MDNSNKERLGKAIKLRAEAFLLDAAEFFPFGTYINKIGTLIPCRAYAEDEKRSSEIDLFDKHITRLFH